MAGLVVGFTGHRENRLPPEEIPRIRRQIADALRRLQGRHAPHRCTLINGAADGADLIAAEVAMALGWRYVALLPFSRARFEKNFPSPESLQQFNALLARAHKVIESPAHDALSDTKDAYEANGAALVARSDALVTVWDGKRAHGRGGTGDAVAFAREQGLKVHWISTDSGTETKELNA